MRIAFVLDTFGGGGKERRCLQIVQGLNKKGITDILFIIINNNIAYHEIYQTTAKVIVMDRKNSNMGIFNTYTDLKNYLLNFQPDIVQGWGFLSLAFLNIIRLRHKFIYIASHVADANKPIGKNKLVNMSVNCLCDAIIGNSQAGLKAYSVKPNKAYCFYNGFNVERLNKTKNIDKKELRKDLNIDTKHIITMVARVDGNKDYDCFLAVARCILSLRVDVTFIALGKGFLLGKYIEETKDEDRIRFLGFRSDVENILSISSLSLLCTNYYQHGEGISNTILESMALGVPTIATLCGGTPEIIDNGKNGFCICNNNVNDFVSKINLLLDNDSLYNKFSSASKETIKNRFSLQKSIDEYLNLYNNFISKAK